MTAATTALSHRLRPLLVAICLGAAGTLATGGRAVLGVAALVFTRSFGTHAHAVPVQRTPGEVEIDLPLPASTLSPADTMVPPKFQKP